MLGVVVIAAFGALDEPALQEIITGQVGETGQGAVQGGLAILSSLMGIIGPTIGAALFASFSGPRALAEVPGMPFFVGAALILIGLVWAASALRDYRSPTP
jgi:DHA1 family tetracycline resistance protein-like MFS transporter